MKKSLFLITSILLATGLLFASPSWIGVQGTGSYTQETTTFTFLGLQTEQEHTASLGGLNIAGTIYPGESPVGIGFQFGSSKTFAATRGSSELDVEDYPLTWNGGVMAKFRAGMTEMIALEVGAGLMYERTITTYDFSGTEAQATLNTLSLASSVDVILHLSDSLALVGGVGASFPLNSQATYTVSGISYDQEFDVKGYTFNGKVGVAFGL